MEIEVGEYIRTTDGEIHKIKSIEANFIEFEDGYGVPVGLRNYIVKHSKNPIDLIEVGDYVNGYRVVEIMEDMKTGEIHLEMTSDYTNQEKGDCTIYNKDIKSIVTKEAYKNIEYRL